MADEVVVDRLGPVTKLTLNRERSANAINVGMALAIAEAIDAFGADESAPALVVTGAGERSFCAGGDLSELLEITDHSQATGRGRSVSRASIRASRRSPLSTAIATAAGWN